MRFDGPAIDAARLKWEKAMESARATSAQLIHTQVEHRKAEEHLTAKAERYALLILGTKE
jgi:hypothetical protein